jgi:hypothetical protein
MAEQPRVDGATQHEQFVNDCQEMDLAWADGRFDEWLQEKLNRERLAAGSAPAA